MYSIDVVGNENNIIVCINIANSIVRIFIEFRIELRDYFIIVAVSIFIYYLLLLYNMHIRICIIILIY